MTSKTGQLSLSEILVNSMLCPDLGAVLQVIFF